MKLCEKNSCSGCFACVNICPKDCISMEEGVNGHLFPVCDEDKCINCGLCEKICPALTPVVCETPHTAYAAWNKDISVQKKSSSGGVSALLANFIINEGGVVYGAAFDKDWNVGHIRCDSTEALDKLRTSKYVQSYIGDTYAHVQKDLKTGIKVMFVGTPCQVAGLKGFLRKDYDNLYLADLVCHGVPSKKVYKDDITPLVDFKNLQWIYFRGLFGEKYGYGFVFEYPNKVDKYPLRQSYYIKGFMDGLFFRESCYCCKYANTNRTGDITIGDFWGIGKKIPFENPEKRRVSLALINTEKGRAWFDGIKSDLHFEERTIEEAVEGNPQLRKPIDKPDEYEKFKKLYPKKGYLKAMRMTYPKMYLRLLMEKLGLKRKTI